MSRADTELLNSQILPKVVEIHKLIRSFHSTEVKDFQKIVGDLEKVEDELRDKQQQCENYINEIKNKRKDQDKIGHLSKGVLEAKSEQIKSKIKNIDAVSAGIKETVAKIKPQNLCSLPVQKDRNLNKTFTVVYQTLYSQEKDEFNWSNFKKLALQHEEGEDFVSRLVNFNFKQMSEEKYEKLLELKCDPQFENMSVKSKFANQVIDLADWVDYVCLGHQFNTDKKRAEKDYDKIRKDLDKKSKGSLQMSQDFWKEASTQIEKYQTQMQLINSEAKGIFFGLKKSLDDSSQLQASTQSKIKVIESGK